MTLLLAQLVDTSERVAASAGRLAKRDAIAECLRQAQGDEIPIAVAYLAGEIPQGRIGVGYATLAGQRDVPAAAPSLTLIDVNTLLEGIATTSGKGSAGARSAQLQTLFARATAAEQDFLLRLLIGELRQGALEGVMIEAIASAAGVGVPEVRRAAMFAGSAATAARGHDRRRRRAGALCGCLAPAAAADAGPACR